MKHLSNRILLACLTSCLSLVASSAFASGSTPSNLNDILYQDSDWGSNQLRPKGYTFVNSDHHKGNIIEYWWGAGPNTCLRVKEVDNKYEAINTTSSTDCNQYHKEATKDDSGAKTAVAAAAILGVVALASKSHHRDDKHNQDTEATAQFERGYRDGLHHKGYHNYDNTTAYSDGYSSGQAQRDEETHHHSHSGHHSGYQSYVSLNDLVGVRASGAENTLRSRGFSDTGGYKQNGKSFVTWWNERTRQCVNVVTKGGRIKRIESINEGNCI